MMDERRIRKPLMEKKRRARINESLEALKQILIECDPEIFSRTGHKSAKLEKADILEMTVNYIQKVTSRRYCTPPVCGMASNPGMIPYQPTGYLAPVFPHSMQVVAPAGPLVSRHPDPNVHFVNNVNNVPKVGMMSPPSSSETAYQVRPCRTEQEKAVNNDIWRPW